MYRTLAECQDATSPQVIAEVLEEIGFARWVTVAPAIIVPIVLIPPAVAFREVLNFGPTQWAAIGAVVGIVVAALIHFLLQPFFMRRVRAALRKRGYAACVPCGYDLRGSPRRCPECGVSVVDE